MFGMKKHFPSSSSAGGSIEFLIVGLGNPGKEYEETRHNIGFLALDALADKLGTSLKRIKFKSLCGEAVLEGRRVLLLKPTTYMNLSGEAVGEAAAFYKIPPEKILVIYDDVTLDVGVMRIRRSGSAGGHNGIKSILAHLGSDAFPRIKIGVGQKPDPRWDLADWVMKRFSKEDAQILKPVLEKAGTAASLIVAGETDKAMNQFNG